MEPIRHTTAVVIPAAGSGTRLGADIPKAFVDINGEPMIVRAARAFTDCASIIIAAPPADVSTAQNLLRAHGLPQVQVVAGGPSRAESIEHALVAVPAQADYVLVHDAARPAVGPTVIERVLDALATGADAVVPVVPVTDSLKRVADGVVVAHSDRTQFARAQTPQGFRRRVLQDAYASARRAGTMSLATDDATLVSESGTTVTTVAGDEANIKVTTAADLQVLRGASSDTQLRSATGTDVHGFADAGTLALAGLMWPEVPALAGHSDGDAALHALCDAFLSAAGLGDLGQQFGVAEPQWAGASSTRLLERTLQLLGEHGWQPVSAQVQIIGNRPRFASRRAEAEQVVSAIVGIDVYFSATTTDGLGFLGRGEGIAATANVLIRRRESERVTS